MINFISAGDYKIQNGFGHDGSLIFRAATTCYRNEEDINKTKEEFITMIKKNNHTAMLEFMWIVLEFDISKYADVFVDHVGFHNYVADQLMPDMTKYIDIKNMGDGKLFVYGNARAFYQHIGRVIEMHDSGVISALPSMVIDTMLSLQNINPVLFDYGLPDSWGESRCSIVQSDDLRITADPDLNWTMVKFTDVSRGMANEEVRHRVFSFAQVSTRYVNCSNMSIIFPFDMIPEDARQRTKDGFAVIMAAYDDLLSRGVSKNIARQLLPIGIATDICVAGTIAQWKDQFVLRTPLSAHWEIREIMNRLQTDLLS